MSTVENIAEMLKNAYGLRAKIVVDLGGCDCPTPDCDGTLDTTDQGDLEDQVWCEECEWEGTCHDLLVGENPHA